MVKASKISKPKIAVAGVLCLDICPGFTAPEADGFGEIIRPGQITHIEGGSIHPGGPVANTGMALSIFGVQPVLHAKVGKDDFGRMLCSALGESCGEDSIATIAVDPDQATAYSVILAPKGIDRAILQNPGANDFFSYDDIDWNVFSECRVFHLGHPSAMKMMFKDCGRQLRETMKSAHERGIVTSLDLCAIDPASDAAQVDWGHILSETLPFVDFFMPSIDDLTEIFDYDGCSGDKPHDQNAAMSLTDERDRMNYVCSVAHNCRSMGAGSVIIKMGDEGLYYDMGDEHQIRVLEEKLGLGKNTMSDWSARKGHAPACYVENVVSGLGAGDISIAALLASMVREFSFDDAIDNMRRQGALCVTDASAIGALKSF